MADANQADFFGEGVNQMPAAPDEVVGPDGLTDTQRAALRLRQNQVSSIDGPALQKAFGSIPTVNDIVGTTTDSNGNQINIVRGSPQGDAAYNAQLGYVSDPTGTGNLQFSPPGTDTGATASSLGSNPVVSQSQQQGNNLANNVLGTQPTTNPATDPTKANMAALTPVIDPNLATSPETDRALAQSQDLINRILNQPLQTKILGDQALASQLALARSGRGGPGAVQSALDQAQVQAPQLQQQATQQSIQEQIQRAGAAGQAASIYAGVATNDANRAVNIATANQNAGVQVLNNLTTLTGQQLNFDANKMQAIGQLARDYFANSQAFAQMDVQTQIAQWDDLTKRYGIDVNAKTAIEAVAAQKKIGPLDALKVVLGIGSSAAGLAAL